MLDTLTPGLTATVRYEVPEQRTVPHLLPEAPEFSTMPEVLATGFLVGLVEWACMQALADHLEPGERTLGIHVDLSHEAPTPPSSMITIEVELVAVERRRLTFQVTARDDAAIICRGRHQRAVIALDRFVAALSSRTLRSTTPTTSVRPPTSTTSAGG